MPWTSIHTKIYNAYRVRDMPLFKSEIKNLIQSKESINALNAEKNTLVNQILLYLKDSDNINDVVQYLQILVDNGANINILAASDMPALMIAAHYKWTPIVKWLLDNNVNIYMKMLRNKMSAVDYAKGGKYTPEITKMILDHDKKFAPLNSNKRNYTILGEGSYGAVLQPAFNNINANGNPVPFPGKVVKLYTDKNDYNKSMTDYKLLKEKVPNLAINQQIYTRKFKGNTIKSLRATFDKDPAIAKIGNLNLIKGVENTNEVYTIRMPNLGDSIFDVYKSPEKSVEYSKHVPKVFLEQIYKLMNHVKRTKDAGYIHGDIRQTNIMANLDTGVLTIIDFDWFSTRDKFISDYPRPFYSMPPEICLFLEYMNQGFDRLSTPLSEIDTRITNILDKYYNSNPNVYPYSILFKIAGANATKQYDNFKAEATSGIKKIYDDYNKADTEDDKTKILYRYKNNSLDTIDSFGLGVTLSFLAEKAIPETKHTRLLKPTLLNLFRDMAQPDINKRITIEEAIEMITEYITNHHYDIDLATILPPPSEAAIAGAAARAEASFREASESTLAKSIRAAMAASANNTSGAAGGTTAGGRRRARKTRCGVRKHAKKSRGKSRKN